MKGSGGSKFVGRAGQKLEAALEAFEIDVAGATCADFGCNVGGFTDCLLGRGAARVYAVDSGYGVLAWRLRRSDRVVVMERTNVLRCPAPEPVDLVAVDVGWTPQSRAVPAAARWLKSGGRIVSLLKPHYELAKLRGARPHERLDEAEARRVCLEVCRHLGDGPDAPCEVRAVMRSALRGKGGNVEFLLLLARREPTAPVRSAQRSVDAPAGGK